MDGLSCAVFGSSLASSKIVEMTGTLLMALGLCAYLLRDWISARARRCPSFVAAAS
jgi:hypothetical protein